MGGDRGHYNLLSLIFVDTSLLRRFFLQVERLVNESVQTAHNANAHLGEAWNAAEAGVNHCFSMDQDSSGLTRLSNSFCREAINSWTETILLTRATFSPQKANPLLRFPRMALIRAKAMQ